MSEVTGLDVVMRGLDAWVKGTRVAAVSAAHEIAEMLETYAKANHPWKRDSGDTDKTTKGTVHDEDSDAILILLSAGMPYDEILELARGGKWAWLWPAVMHNQDKIRALLKRRMGNASVKR